MHLTIVTVRRLNDFDLCLNDQLTKHFPLNCSSECENAKVVIKVLMSVMSCLLFVGTRCKMVGLQGAPKSKPPSFISFVITASVIIINHNLVRSWLT